MEKIKYINCFGTSYTAGGGHEFGHRNYPSIVTEGTSGNNLEIESTRKYPNEEQTQFNFSWPGQLQKILKTNNSDIVVNNLARSGYGNERLFRKTHEIINSKGFSKDEHIFLFEFAMGPGRRELWSNTLNDYIITNFKFNQDKNMTLDCHGAANAYWYDDIKTVDMLDEFSNNTIHPFYKETVSFKNQVDIEERYLEFFFSYLVQKNINFLITTCPGIHDFFSVEIDKETRIINCDFPGLSGDNFILFLEIDNNYSFNFTNYYENRKLTIENDTNGKCKDGHMGMSGAKIVSKIIYDRLVEIYQKKKRLF